MSRCYDSRSTGYSRYGAVGVSVCAAWHDYSVFAHDMGERPIAATLDRIDGSGDYEPSNCRWASRDEQSRNRKNNRHFRTHDGRAMVLADIASYLAINRGTLQRLFVRAGVL